jgi:hypothetical protein
MNYAETDSNSNSLKEMNLNNSHNNEEPTDSNTKNSNILNITPVGNDLAKVI